MDRHDSRMIGQPGGGGLTQKTASSALIQFALVDLDRDQTAQRQLASLPDHGKAPARVRLPLTEPADVGDAP